MDGSDFIYFLWGKGAKTKTGILKRDPKCKHINLNIWKGKDS